MDAVSPDAGKVRLWARGEVIQMWMARWNALPSRVVQQILLATLIAGCFIDCSGMECKEAQAQKLEKIFLIVSLGKACNPLETLLLKDRIIETQQDAA